MRFIISIILILYSSLPHNNKGAMDADRILTKLVSDGKSPSVQYLIFSTDKVIHKFQYGLADIKNGVKVSDNTQYHGFSVTKTFTALAIMQLVEQQKIQLDDKAIKYLPNFSYSSDITIRQLLTHSSGIPNPIPLSWIHLDQEHASFGQDSFFDEVFKKNNKINSLPGEKYQYSNLGYVILGRIIEKVTDMKYEEYIVENIFVRGGIGKNDLSFAIDQKRIAKGYNRNFSFTSLLLEIFIDKSKYMTEPEKGWRPFVPFHTNGVAYGGVLATPSGLMKYLQELLKRESNLIDVESKKEMFKENLIANGKPSGMCLGWFTGELNGEHYFAHAGGGGGYYCEIRIYPKLNIGSILIFNRTGVKDERLLDKADQYFIGEPSGLNRSK